MAEALPYFLLVIAVMLAFRVIAGSIDGERIDAYVRDRGWELVERSWEPFGPGWLGAGSARIYAIVYRDQAGTLHRAHVKTRALGGVYLTGEETAESEGPEGTSRTDELVRENERLRARVSELEKDA